jgi:hypothetical protein
MTCVEKGDGKIHIDRHDSAGLGVAERAHCNVIPHALENKVYLTQ